MATEPLSTVLGRLRGVVAFERTKNQSDGELLCSFRQRQDQDAFAALLRRHGRLVWHICRRVLRNKHDAEDAFQATFLVLARKAGSIRQAESVSSWLHGVAHRIAMETKRKAARRRAHERQVPCQSPQPAISETAWQALQEALDEELRQLPEKYRAPFLLCCLENKSLADAAKQLGWKVGTVSGRLSKARHILQDRLSKRGVMLSAVLTGLAVGPSAATAAVPASVATATTQAALAFATGSIATAGVISANVLALTKADLKGMLFTKVKILTAVVLTMTLAATAVGIASHQVLRQEDIPPPSPPPTLGEGRVGGPAEEPTAGVEKKPREPRVDLYGDPLPEGAIARLGTMRWRMDRRAHLLEFSSEGNTLITATGSDTIQDGIGVRICDRSTGRILKRFEVKGSNRWSKPALSPDKKIIAIPGSAKGIKLLDVATGLETNNAEAKHYCQTVAFSPDGKLLAYEGRWTVGLIDATTGKQVWEMQSKDEEWPLGVAFSADGRIVASRGQKLIRIWNAKTGKVIQRWTIEMPNEVRGRLHATTSLLSLSPDNRTLAWGIPGDPNLHLFDYIEGKPIRDIKGSGPILWARYSPSGRFLVWSDSSKANGWLKGTIHLWDAKANTELKKGEGERIDLAQRTFPPLGDPSDDDLAARIGLAQVTFSPDEKTLATAGNAIHLIDLETMKEINPVSGPLQDMRTIAFTPDSRTVVSRSYLGTFRFWDSKVGRETRDELIGVPHNNQVAHEKWLAYSPDFRRFAAAGDDGVIRLHDLADGKEIRKWKAHNTAVYEVKFSPDGRTLISTGPDETLRFWNVETVKELRRIGSLQLLGSLAYSPDGKLVAAAAPLLNSGDFSAGRNLSVIHIWNASTGKELRRTEVRHSSVHSLEFSPDCRTLAISGGSRREGDKVWRAVTLLEVASGGERSDFSVEWWQYNDNICFSPDGTLLAAPGDGSNIRVWDLASRTIWHEFKGMKGYPVYCFAFSPDGRLLATGSPDTTGLIWDIESLRAKKPKRHQNLTTEQLDSLWTQLALFDASKADRAIWQMVAAPESSVAFLREKLNPAKKIDAKLIRQWVKDLDSDDFHVREKATTELTKVANFAESVLRERLKATPSLDLRRRIEQLLEVVELQTLRPLEVLEHIAAPGADATRLAALDLLKKLAAGAPQARLTQEAKASLERLDKRPK